MKALSFIHDSTTQGQIIRHTHRLIRRDESSGFRDGLLFYLKLAVRRAYRLGYSDARLHRRPSRTRRMIALRGRTR